jgi:hypothetical protein
MTGQRGDGCTHKPTDNENRSVTTTASRTPGLLRGLIEEQRRTDAEMVPHRGLIEEQRRTDPEMVPHRGPPVGMPGPAGSAPLARPSS